MTSRPVPQAFASRRREFRLATDGASVRVPDFPTFDPGRMPDVPTTASVAVPSGRTQGCAPRPAGSEIRSAPGALRRREATLSVPAWLGTLRLCIRTYWVTEKGIKRRADGSEFIVQNPPVDKITCAEGQQVTVTLPRRPATLVGKLDRGLQRLPTTTELQRSTSSKGSQQKSSSAATISGVAPRSTWELRRQIRFRCRRTCRACRPYLVASTVRWEVGSKGGEST
jgi:hypothetical protein